MGKGRDWGGMGVGKGVERGMKKWKGKREKGRRVKGWRWAAEGRRWRRERTSCDGDFFLDPEGLKWVSMTCCSSGKVQCLILFCC